MPLINQIATQYLEFSKDSFLVRIANFRVKPLLAHLHEEGYLRTANNSPVVFGPVEKDYYELSFTAQLTEDEYDQLFGCYQESRNARQQYQDPGVQVDCTITKLREKAPISRSLVPTTSIATVGTLVKYNPRLKMMFAEWEEIEISNVASFERVVRVKMLEIDSI